MKKLSEFTTLVEAQNYGVKGSRMISPDLMVAFLAQTGCLVNTMAGTSEEAEGLKIALQFGSEFNLIEGHPLSVAGMMDKIPSITQEFRALATGYANPMSYPYAGITQEDFDIAQLEGETLSTETTYNGSSAQPHLPNVAIRQVDVTCKFDQVLPKETTVELFVEHKDGDTLDFIPYSRSFVFTVEKGVKATTLTLPRNFKRHIKVKGKVHLKNTGFTLDVVGE